MKKAMMIVVMCLLVWCSGPKAAGAVLLIDSGPPTSPFSGFNIFDNQFLAQQFTLPIGATITQIAFFGGRIGTGPDPLVNVQLTNAIGPGTSSSALLADLSLTVSNFFGSSAFLPIPTSFFLDPGTYFLVLSSNAPLADSAVWATGPPNDIGPEFISSSSLINSGFPPASQFFPNPLVGFQDFGLRISGNPGAPIPEPGTLLLLGSGLAGLGISTRRRSRRK